MEAASYKELLSLKTHYLEEQRKQLHTLVDKQVDKVLQMSNRWPEKDDTGKTLTFKEISLLLEDTSVFMTEKCIEMTSVAQGSTETEPSPDVTTTTHVITAASETSVPQSGSGNKMEEMAKSFQEMEECVKQLREKQSKMEMEQNNRFEKIEDKLEKTRAATESQCHLLAEEMEKHKKEKKKTETSMQQLKKSVETVELDMKELRSHVDYVETCCNYDKQLEAFGGKLEKLEEVLGKAEEFEALKEEVSKCKRLRETDKPETTGHSVAKIDTLKQKLKDIGQTVEQLKITTTKFERLEILEQKMENHEANLSRKVAAVEFALQDLTRSTDANACALKNSSSQQERDAEKLKEVETRLTGMKRNNKEAVQNLAKKLVNVEKQYKMVCQIVADRVTPLEKLRDVFNKKISHRDENIKKLHDVVHEVGTLVPRISVLETSCRKQPVGFSANFEAAQRLIKGDLINHFTNVSCDSGDNFDPSTGIFTVPVDGLYGVSLSIFQWHEGRMSLHVINAYTEDDESYEDRICIAETCRGNTCGYDFAVAELEAGDTLHVIVDSFEKRPRLADNTTFTCFLIG